MSKSNNKRGNSGETAPAETVVEATQEAIEAGAVSVNHVLTYRRDHPGDRCSYGIAGNAGIVVFDKGLFANGIAPATIIVDCDMVPVKADNKTAKAEAAAAKLVEKAAKAQAKIEAAQAKAEEKKAKAEAALAAAQAKVVEAQAKAAADAAAPAAPAAPTVTE